MTTRPPLIPVEQVDLVELVAKAMAETRLWLWDKLDAERGRYDDVDECKAFWLDAARAALTALEPHLEASRLQARREALEEAAELADKFTGGNPENHPTERERRGARMMVQCAENIALAIRTLRGES